MAPFFATLLFNGCVKSRNIGVSTLRCAKKLRAMLYSVEFLKKLYLRLCSPHYATQCEIQAKNFLVDSALCSAVTLRYMHHYAESLIFANCSANSQPYTKMIELVDQIPK
jgi:hypothetical protein